MQSIYVKFLNEPDRTRGFFELIRRARGSSFPGEVYQIPREARAILDELNVLYREATSDEVKESHDQARNPSLAVLD